MDCFISVSPMGGYFNENITYTSLITKTKIKKVNFLVLRRFGKLCGRLGDYNYPPCKQETHERNIIDLATKAVKCEGNDFFIYCMFRQQCKSPEMTVKISTITISLSTAGVINTFIRMDRS